MTDANEYNLLALKAAENHVNTVRTLFLAQIIEALDQNTDSEDTAEFVIGLLRESLTEYQEVLANV